MVESFIKTDYSFRKIGIGRSFIIKIHFSTQFTKSFCYRFFIFKKANRQKKYFLSLNNHFKSPFTFISSRDSLNFTS
jgi:hypothetical protein